MINKKSIFAKRMQLSYDTKESNTSTKKVGVMNWKDVDNDVIFFSPVEGRNRINIIPYTIKTKNHPLVKRGEFKVGDKDYLMDVYVHRNVGASEASVLCLKSTFGKPCPICEQMAMFKKQGKEKEANELKPSRRVFYNVQDMKEPDKIKVFEASHYLFERELIDEARDDEEGGFVDFVDTENGKEIKFRCNEVQKGSIKYKEYKSFSFEDRDDPIADNLVESAISFDAIMNVPTYEEVENLLYGKDEDDESANNADENDLDESVVENPMKLHKDTVNELVNDAIEDDEPAPVKHCNNNCSGCKCGHNFGADVDKFDDCDDCDDWEKCAKAK